MRLADKVVIITGGGSGLGRAGALLFAREGAKVVIAQRTEETGNEIVAAIKANGGEAAFIRTDVTSTEEVKNLIDKAVSRYGKIDVLYNNAGTEQPRIPVENVEIAMWDNVFAGNVKSIYLTVKYAIPVMKQAKYGVIINTTSMLGIRPKVNIAAYVSSKGAVTTLTEQLAVELAPFNIRVNCIASMGIDTPLLRRQTAHITWEEYVKNSIAITPLGKMATPEDVAYAALYLASDESKMITGSCIKVDGGRGVQ